jgi:hypothetical protein
VPFTSTDKLQGKLVNHLLANVCCIVRALAGLAPTYTGLLNIHGWLKSFLGVELKYIVGWGLSKTLLVCTLLYVVFFVCRVLLVCLVLPVSTWMAVFQSIALVRRNFFLGVKVDDSFIGKPPESMQHKKRKDGDLEPIQDRRGWTSCDKLANQWIRPSSPTSYS